MSQTQGLIQEPQFMRSQVVAQQPATKSSKKLSLNIGGQTLSLSAFASFFSYPRSYSYFTYSYFR